jgi:hypothetical protein
VNAFRVPVYSHIREPSRGAGVDTLGVPSRGSACDAPGAAGVNEGGCEWGREVRPGAAVGLVHGARKAGGFGVPRVGLDRAGKLDDAGDEALLDLQPKGCDPGKRGQVEIRVAEPQPGYSYTDLTETISSQSLTPLI